MIEFPTDKKISNLQLRPNGTEALTIQGKSFLKKTENDEWEIPSNMFPIDYQEINLSTPANPEFTPELVMSDVNGNTYGAIANDLHILYSYVDGIPYYGLNLHGLYKINTGLNRLTYSTTAENNEDTNSFINNENGYEIVESKNEKDEYVYIIHPTISLEKRNVVLSFGNNPIAVLLIYSCFVKPHDEYRMKINGKIPNNALVSVWQSGIQKLYLDIESQYVSYESITLSDAINKNLPYTVNLIVQEDGNDRNIAQAFYVVPS